MGILWANYKQGGFPNLPEGLEQSEFAENFLQWLASFNSAFFIEDKTKAFKAGTGPVCMVVVLTDGDIIKPIPIVFAWASTRNKLRSTTAFIHFAKYSSDVAVCVIYTTREEEEMMRRQRRYENHVFNLSNGIWCFSGRKKNPRRQD